MKGAQKQVREDIFPPWGHRVMVSDKMTIDPFPFWLSIDDRGDRSTRLQTSVKSRRMVRLIPLPNLSDFRGKQENVRLRLIAYRFIKKNND